MQQRRWLQQMVLIGGLVWVAACGGVTSTAASGGGDSDSTRNLTGSVTLSAVSTTLAVAPGKAMLKDAVASCTDLSLCCFGYNGDTAVDPLDASCQFDLALPLGNYCYCGFFTGTDGDGDGCPDTYANLSLDPVPVFADADGSTDAIDTGECDADDCANDIDDQVDEDGDGTDNAADTDDDGDGVGDSEDDYTEGGLENLLQFDSDEDGIPDLFEDLWTSFVDTDGDDIPNFADFDVDGDGQDNDADSDDDGDGSSDDTDADDYADGYDDNINAIDTDGDGIPNILDWDIDGDGITNINDTDDDDDGTTDDADTDSNGDGVTEGLETDSDGDSIPDEWDVDAPTTCESDTQCQAALMAFGIDDATILDATSCTTSDGECLLDCHQLGSGPDEICATQASDAGATCSDMHICVFTL